MNPAKESEITMASVEKFSAGAVRNQLRHNRREIEHSGNPDIDPSRQGQDYVLSPDRGMTEYDYFLQRKSELYCYNRDDVKVMAGWVVTAPQDLDPERYDDFFCATYDFLENRYGKENVVQAIVHDDEGGQPVRGHSRLPGGALRGDGDEDHCADHPLLLCHPQRRPAGAEGLRQRISV